MPHAYGEVVLVPFPFTDQSGAKQRPAVVVSSDGYNAKRRDLVIMAITSQTRQPYGFGETPVNAWQAAGLLKPSAIKPILTTIEQALVIRTLGALSSADRIALRESITRIIG